ncbi:hypothetical protein BH23PLA1_BH23PLA1_33410 [soil metagenome]
MRWVIAYDVHCHRNRRRLAKRLEQLGFRRQKSVFEEDADPTEVEALLDELTPCLSHPKDALTAWPTAEYGPARIVHRGLERTETHREWTIL